jgi:2-dehydropantoate 2-reductase
VETDVRKVEWGRAHGVGIDGLSALPARFECFADWRPDPSTILLLCTKCYDNAAVFARVSAGVALVPIQNGFDPELESRPGCLEGIASFISECYPDRTQTRITRPGSLHLGFRGPARENDAERLQELAEALSQQGRFRVQVVPDIRPYKYTKLMYNAAISPLAAAAGLDNGRLLSCRSARRLFFDLLAENYRILNQAGVALEKVGPFHPTTVQRILSHRFLANALAWAFYPTLRKTYCSMAGDLPQGRTEIDYYNRHLIDLAGERPCPLNRRVYALVKRMERERVPPNLGVLADLAA